MLKLLNKLGNLSSRVLNACQQPLTHQIVSIRIKQQNEINNNHINGEDDDYLALWPVNSTNENSKWVMQNAILVGHTLSLLRE